MIEPVFPLAPKITYMSSLTTATFSLELFIYGSSLSAYVLLICTYNIKKITGSPGEFPQLHRPALFHQEYSRSSPEFFFGPMTGIP